MADTIFTSQTPFVQNDFDGDSHSWGMKFTVSADSSCTGGRAWVPAGGRPTTFLWQLWRVGDSTKLAETDLRGAGHGTPSSGTWMSFDSSLFTTPGNVALSSAQTYIVCVHFAGGDGVHTDNGTETFPVGSGGLVSASTGRFSNSNGSSTMPANDYVAYFYADVNVVAPGVEHTKSVSGSITPMGAISKAVFRGLSGSIAPVGAVLKLLSRLLGGTITPAGSVSNTPPVRDIATTYAVGPPHGRWHAAAPHGRWDVGQPWGRWHIGPPRGE